MPATIVRSSLLSALPGIDHGFTSRLTPPAFRAELAKTVSIGRQVHKDYFAWPTRWEHRETEADGLGSLSPGFYVGAYSADCAPILLALTEGSRVKGVMAVHAGWRGTALGIAGRAVHALVEKAGVGAAAKLFAVVGPCIGPENFEVGEDVIAAFPHVLAQGIARVHRPLDDGTPKYLFHLGAENLRQLRVAAQAAGVELEVADENLCTVADQNFPSFRRDRTRTDQIVSYIAFGTDRPLGA